MINDSQNLTVFLACSNSLLAIYISEIYVWRRTFQIVLKHRYEELFNQISKHC